MLHSVKAKMIAGAVIVATLSAVVIWRDGVQYEKGYEAGWDALQAINSEKLDKDIAEHELERQALTVKADGLQAVLTETVQAAALAAHKQRTERHEKNRTDNASLRNGDERLRVPIINSSCSQVGQASGESEDGTATTHPRPAAHAELLPAFSGDVKEIFDDADDLAIDYNELLARYKGLERICSEAWILVK